MVQCVRDDYPSCSLCRFFCPFRRSAWRFWVSGLLAIILPALAVTVRRLHDTDRSGWWFLIQVIPFGGLVLLVFMVLSGTSGTKPLRAAPDVTATGHIVKQAPRATRSSARKLDRERASGLADVDPARGEHVEPHEQGRGAPPSSCPRKRRSSRSTLLWLGQSDTICGRSASGCSRRGAAPAAPKITRSGGRTT